MREFLLLALKAPTDERFSLDNRSESAIICRTILNAFFASQGLRRDTNVFISLNSGALAPKLLSFLGEQLIELPQHESELAALIRKALLKGIKLQYGEEIEIVPGLKVAKKPFETLVKEKSETTQLFYLHPRGEDIRKAALPENALFVLGDLFGIPNKTEKLLKRFATRVTLGPIMLFAAHCPILVHNELDRVQREWER